MIIHEKVAPAEAIMVVQGLANTGELADFVEYMKMNCCIPAWTECQGCGQKPIDKPNLPSTPITTQGCATGNCGTPTGPVSPGGTPPLTPDQSKLKEFLCSGSGKTIVGIIKHVPMFTSAATAVEMACTTGLNLDGAKAKLCEILSSPYVEMILGAAAPAEIAALKTMCDLTPKKLPSSDGSKKDAIVGKAASADPATAIPAILGSPGIQERLGGLLPDITGSGDGATNLLAWVVSAASGSAADLNSAAAALGASETDRQAIVDAGNRGPGAVSDFGSEMIRGIVG
jgi:hypothetical protein